MLDLDLVRLRSDIELVALRVRLNEATSDDQRGAIYLKIAQLDPADRAAVAEAAEYDAQRNQSATVSEPTA